MIPWFAPRLTGNESTFIRDVLDSGFINDGPRTREFEDRVASLVGRQHGVAVPNGTSAIALALMAKDAGGWDVIVPDFTIVCTANAVRLAGGNVVLADIDRRHFCLTADTVEQARTPRTRFVVAVEVNGRQPDYVPLTQYCKDTGLTLITDSCEALGSGNCGSMGVASCLSFSPNKIITTGQGGMVVTNDPAMLKRLRQLKYQGFEQPGLGPVAPTLGFNFKFTDLQAAVGLAQLREFGARANRLLQRDVWYWQALDGCVELPAHRLYGMNLWADILVPRRVELAAHLRSHSIGVREFWTPLHRQPEYRTDRAFPIADEVSDRGIWLPSSYDITKEQVGYVANCIKERVS